MIIYKPRSVGFTDACIKEGDYCMYEPLNAREEVKVEPSDGKPPYKRKIKTEAETVKELKGITISTEADPNYSDETESESDDSGEKDSDK
jgi:hypothetical protein